MPSFAIYHVVNALSPIISLTLAVLPGPKEPKKYEINHYLHSIINQLNQLWVGYNIKTYENNNSRFVCDAVISCSNDVPAS